MTCLTQLETFFGGMQWLIVRSTFLMPSCSFSLKKEKTGVGWSFFKHSWPCKHTHKALPHISCMRTLHWKLQKRAHVRSMKANANSWHRWFFVTLKLSCRGELLCRVLTCTAYFKIDVRHVPGCTSHWYSMGGVCAHINWTHWSCCLKGSVLVLVKGYYELWSTSQVCAALIFHTQNVASHVYMKKFYTTKTAFWVKCL